MAKQHTETKHNAHATNQVPEAAVPEVTVQNEDDFCYLGQNLLCSVDAGSLQHLLHSTEVMADAGSAAIFVPRVLRKYRII